MGVIDFLRDFGVDLVTFLVCTFVLLLTWSGDDLGMGEGDLCNVDVFGLDLANVLSVSISLSALRWIGVFLLVDATGLDILDVLDALDVLDVLGAGLANLPSASLSCVLGEVVGMFDIDFLNDKLLHRFLS